MIFAGDHIYEPEERYKIFLETTEKIGLSEYVAELKRRYGSCMKGNFLREYY